MAWNILIRIGLKDGYFQIEHNEKNKRMARKKAKKFFKNLLKQWLEEELPKL